MFSYKCPICSRPLELQQRSFICENKHCFDVAKEGYVNLLPVQRKKSLIPGDSKEMLTSRQRFLEGGYYYFLVEAVAELITQHCMDDQNPIELLDMGCGEGYYCQQLLQKNQSLHITAVDIAKQGVLMTAKRKLGLQAAVASVYEMPFFGNSFDCALSIFSPVSGVETARVLKPKGKLIIVGPADKHLRGLVEHVYTEPTSHQGNTQALADTEAFTLLEQKTISDQIRVQGEAIMDLLAMTPYFWQCTAEQQSKLAEMACIETPLEFQISVYVNNKSSAIYHQ